MDKILEKLEKLKKLSDTSSKRARKTSTNADTSITDTPSKTSGGGADNRHRMTEKEEDEELMLNDADELENEDELITRFDASPWCKFISIFPINSIHYFNNIDFIEL